MKKQFINPIQTKKDLLIRNSKFSCYDIVNSLELSQLNLLEGRIPPMSEMSIQNISEHPKIPSICRNFLMFESMGILRQM